MFNRKITSESFDESLDGFEDFLQDPLATKDFSNKSKTNDTSAIDIETGEVLSPQTRVNQPHQKLKSDHTTTRPIRRKPQPSQNEALTTNLSLLIPIGSSLFFSLIVCLIGYLVFSTEFSKISLKVDQTTTEVSDLNKSIDNLQTTFSVSDEAEEVFAQLEDLSNNVESLENTLQTHLQSTNKTTTIPATKKVSPSDALKNISYLGFFGTTDQPIALIKVKDEKKEFKTGQLLIDSWLLSAIQPNHITLSHTTGMIQNITRKKPLF